MKGHIRKRGKGWEYTYDVGRDVSGRRRQRTRGGFATKGEAQRELRRILHELDTGAFVEPAKISVAEYLQRWLRDYAKFNVRETTFVRYAEIVEKHLIPSLGGFMLPKLKPLHIQAYYTDAIETGRRDGRGGLSPTTVLQHHRILRKALQQAIRWQLLSLNPADSVTPPRRSEYEMGILDEHEALSLIKASEGGRYHIPILLAVTTGMRRGEILGLRWRDVDLDSGIIHVRQTLTRVGNETKFKQPKTAKSRRSVAMLLLTTEALRVHKKYQAEQRLALGPAYNEMDLVCAQADGAPLKPGSFSKTVTASAKKLGLPRITLHGLRHSHASHLFRLGQHPKLVSERLGHSSTGITQDLYTHMLPGMQDEAARQLDESLKNISKNQ